MDQTVINECIMSYPYVIISIFIYQNWHGLGIIGGI